MMSSTVLITGGLGYIGSHTCVALIEAGYQVVILDNHSNSKPHALNRIAQILGFVPQFVLGDIRDQVLLNKIFKENKISAVMHFAGLKRAGESLLHPLSYFDNNIAGTVGLLLAMKKADIRTLVFSSSAAVYGEPRTVPICENNPCLPASPYGRSKLFVEDILNDLFESEPEWCIARLRYFNPAGAHSSGLIGDDPNGTPSSLVPCIAQVAAGIRERLQVFGSDYPTSDGTGVRDYIHVMDLAAGHVSALRRCLDGHGILITVNLGSGAGNTVMQVVRAFESVCAKKIPYEFLPRRRGDISHCWADTTLAVTTLGWKATRTLFQICEDSWRWQSNN